MHACATNLGLHGGAGLRFNLFEADRLAQAGDVMAWGFFKKLVIADRLTPLADAAYRAPTRTQSALLIVGTVALASQIFAGFSGYTDIARGARRVLGAELIKNLVAPYGATSVREFWTRWPVRSPLGFGITSSLPSEEVVRDDYAVRLICPSYSASADSGTVRTGPS
jgi:hypothetical protein